MRRTISPQRSSPLLNRGEISHYTPKNNFIRISTALSGTKLSKVTFTDIYIVFITNSAEHQIVHWTFPVLVFFLPAGHWVQSTAAEGCFASACEKRWRAALQASSDQPGDFRLPGVRNCAELPSKSNPSFSQCNILSHWPATYGDTELKRQDLSSEDTCAPVCCPDLSPTCFCASVETLLHGYIQLFEDCRHHGFDSEARSRAEASHCVLGLDLWWADADACDSLRVSVI